MHFYCDGQQELPGEFTNYLKLITKLFLGAKCRKAKTNLTYYLHFAIKITNNCCMPSAVLTKFHPIRVFFTFARCLSVFSQPASQEHWSRVDHTNRKGELWYTQKLKVKISRIEEDSCQPAVKRLQLKGQAWRSGPHRR